MSDTCKEMMCDLPRADIPEEFRDWPCSLLKAFQDPFDYAAFVEGLGIIRFTEVHSAGPGWVRLDGIGDWPQNNRLPFRFDRGVEIRLADIRWVADAPNGS